MAQFRWQLIFATILAFGTCLVIFGPRLPISSESNTKTTQNFSRVLGNSMAPTLFGAHHETLCAHCAHINRFATESFPASLCFCGRCRNEIKTPSFQAREGDSVKVEPADSLKRWDIVLVRDPSEPLRIVKRLVAFPGETLQIKLGDLWINGKRIERTLDQILASRITLFTEELASSPKPLPLSNEAEAPSVGWHQVPQSDPTLHSLAPADITQLAFTYREPWNKTKDPQQRNRYDASIVSDWYPENPAFSGPLWPVGDQILELCFVPDTDGELHVCLRDPILDSPHVLALPDWNSSWSKKTWYSGESNSNEQAWDKPPNCLQYILAYVDGAYWFRVCSGQLQEDEPQFISERTLSEWRKIPEELTQPKLQPCAAEVLWSLRYSGVKQWIYRHVARDLYFRRDTWSESRGIPMIRDVEGYYLLGDNQPLSLDSRQKPGWIKGVPRSWIEGRITPQK